MQKIESFKFLIHNKIDSKPNKSCFTEVLAQDTIFAGTRIVTNFFTQFLNSLGSDCHSS